MMGFSPFLEHLLNRLVAVLFWFILAMALFNFYNTRSLASRIVLGMYALVIILALILPKPRIWGRVKRKTDGQPLLTGCVELSHADIPNIVIAKSKIFEDGKYFLRVEPGKYLFRVKGWQPSGQEGVLKEMAISVGSDGMINKSIAV